MCEAHGATQEDLEHAHDPHVAERLQEIIERDVRIESARCRHEVSCQPAHCDRADELALGLRPAEDGRGHILESALHHPIVGPVLGEQKLEQPAAAARVVALRCPIDEASCERVLGARMPPAPALRPLEVREHADEPAFVIEPSIHRAHGVQQCDPARSSQVSHLTPSRERLRGEDGS